MLAALGFFVLVEVVGLAAAPLAALAFGAAARRRARLRQAARAAARDVARVDGGLGHADPYGTATVLVVVALLAVAGGLAAARLRTLAARLSRTGEGWLARRRAEWIGTRALPAEDPRACGCGSARRSCSRSRSPRWRCWSPTRPTCGAPRSRWTWRSSTPSNASDSFPPHDPWMAGEDLNYYYLGHLAMAWSIKLVGHRAGRGYNLAFALLAALTATAVFTFAGTLWAAARPRLAGVARRAGAGRRDRRRGLHRARQPRRRARVARRRRPARRLRLVRAVARDPGHDQRVPVVLVPARRPARARARAAVHRRWRSAFALQVALAGPRGDAVLRGVAEALAAGLAVGVLYAINSWSYPVTAGVLVGAVVIWLRDPSERGRRGYALIWLALVLVASFVLVLPFWLNFDPAARGIALVDERRPFGAFAGRHRADLRDLRLAAGGRVRAPACWPRADPWRARAGASSAASSPARCWPPADLAGAPCSRRCSPSRSAPRSSPRARRPRALPVAADRRRRWRCVIPELVYVARRVRRQRPVPHEHGLQARLPGVAAARRWPPPARCRGPRAWLPRRAWPRGRRSRPCCCCSASSTPTPAPTRARAASRARRRWTACAWLRPTAPGDPGAIDWLRANTPGDAVVLEAFGDDYSAFGHARISTFTGRPTVLGWAGHELQWQHDPGGRADDVRTLYTTDDLERGARADRPLRDRLRRLRPDRADHLRRRRPRQVGRAGRAASSSATARRSGR